LSKITVVTVAKEMHVGLAATLESVRSQEKQSRHLLVDGSDDYQMFDYVSTYFPKVEIIRQKPSGIYSAMNYALSYVPDSDKVLFLNSSDFLLGGNALEILDDSLSLSDTWAYGGVFCFSPETNNSFSIGIEDFSMNSLVKGKLLIPHPSTLIPARWIKALGGFDEKLSIVADIDLAYRVCKKYGAPKHLNEYVSAHELGGVSTTNIKRQTRELRISRIRNFPKFTLLATLEKLSGFSNRSKNQNLGVRELNFENIRHFEFCSQELEFPKCCKKQLEIQAGLS